MLADFENKIAFFFRSRELLIPETRILLAVSGGADSTALLYVIHALKERGIINVELHCAHINHLLRGSDADSDEDFVISQARKLNIDLTTRCINVREFACENKLSIETAARKVRIKALLEIARENNFSVIATGHQKNDNAETVVQRLLRGTGFRGLGGIWPVREFENDVRFIRPLLCVTRSEILEYLNLRNLNWCRDATNDDCKFTRNHIRHNLIPVIQKQCKDSLTEQLHLLSCSAYKYYKRICDYADAIQDKVFEHHQNEVSLDLEMFSWQPVPVKIELVRRALNSSGCGEKDLTQHHYKRILELSERRITGKRLELPGGFLAIRQYQKLIFTRRKGTPCNGQTDQSVELTIPGKTKFGHYSIEAEILELPLDEDFTRNGQNTVERFDFDRIKTPLVVRFRRAGDRFIPLGRKKAQKIGKFLTTQRIPSEIRDKALVIADSENIIWLWPVRMCEQAKISGRTRKILQLKIIEG